MIISNNPKAKGLNYSKIYKMASIDCKEEFSQNHMEIS